MCSESFFCLAELDSAELASQSLRETFFIFLQFAPDDRAMAEMAKLSCVLAVVVMAGWTCPAIALKVCFRRKFHFLVENQTDFRCQRQFCAFGDFLGAPESSFAVCWLSIKVN
jgi:hypothetical protein